MILPVIGISFGSDQLTSTVQTVVAIVTGIWIWYQRTTLEKASGGFGDVSALGVRKS